MYCDSTNMLYLSALILQIRTLNLNYEYIYSHTVNDLLIMQEKDKTFESQTCPFNSENQNAILLTLVILYLI